ncbi:MAG: hydrogenase maturation nickel metallochaperone HypA [Candidatus Omnitrophica bacterium]|nr:hydrogenase maturation nickel metallochaperone HypA [Candidatus Omnitrophota bacterium]
MHEYHLVEKIIRDALTQGKGKEVLEIILSVSDSSGLDPDAIKLYFDEIREKDSRLKDVELSVHPVETKLYCPKCNLDFERINKSFLCPKCAGGGQRSAANRQIHIEKVVFKS